MLRRERVSVEELGVLLDDAALELLAIVHSDRQRLRQDSEIVIGEALRHARALVRIVESASAERG